MAAEYGKHVGCLDNPSDPKELQTEFAVELEWFHKQTTIAVDLIKDKSLKKVLKKAMKEFIDLVW